MNKNIRRWLLVLVCWVGAVGLLGFIKFSQISSAIAFGASFPEPSETVLTTTVRSAKYMPSIALVGQVVPVRSVTLRNELAGTIVEVGFEPGASVKAGQILIHQDISEERALLAAATAQEALAQRTLDRNESLISGSAISRQAVDDALAQRDDARAQAQRIQAVIRKKQVQAPFAGFSGLERWEAGGYLATGTEITTLIGHGEEVWIDFSLPQRHDTVQIGDNVSVSTETTGDLTATIIARAPSVDTVSRAINFRATLNNTQLATVPGAIVAVSVNVGSPQEALVVPALSVREDTFGPHVFTLTDAESDADAPFRAERRAVRVLGVEGERAFIADGLAANEQVVAQGAFKLREGILVNVGAGEDGPDNRPGNPALP